MRTSMLLIPSPAWCPLIASFGSMGGGFKGAFIDSRGSAGGFGGVFMFVKSERSCTPSRCEILCKVLNCFTYMFSCQSGEEVCISLLQNGNSSGMGFNDQLGVVFVSSRIENQVCFLQFSTCSLFISMSENWFSLFFESLDKKNLKEKNSKCFT